MGLGVGNVSNSFEMKQPMSSYLVMLAIGNYSKKTMTTPSGVLLENYYLSECENQYDYTYKSSEVIFKYLEQSFSNIKETIIYNRQNYFEKNFTFYQKILTNVSKDYLTFQQFPRIFLEILVLISVAFLVIFLISLNIDKSLIFVKIGIFSAVAFKILPSINRFVFSYHSIKFGKPLVNSALNEINFDLFKKISIYLQDLYSFSKYFKIFLLLNCLYLLGSKYYFHIIL
jgi:ABC-type multidrug transport system fused ATPase/permease subunit